MTDKSSKAEVQYRDRPSGHDFCAGCTMFERPAGCSAVDGRISSRGWCRLFKRKPEAPE